LETASLLAARSRQSEFLRAPFAPQVSQVGSVVEYDTRKGNTPQTRLTACFQLPTPREETMLYSTHMLRHLRLVIGQNIHRLRAQRELSLRKLATESGVSEELIERYEIGKGDIQLRELLKIACVLAVRADSLFE
jgi:DNA-binding Xre family transcriptional regulator